MSIIKTIFRKFNISYTSMNLFRGILIVAITLFICGNLVFNMNYSDLSWKTNWNGYLNIIIAVGLIFSVGSSMKAEKLETVIKKNCS